MLGFLDTLLRFFALPCDGAFSLALSLAYPDWVYAWLELGVLVWRIRCTTR